MTPGTPIHHPPYRCIYLLPTQGILLHQWVYPQGGKPSFLVMLIHEPHARFTPSETEEPAPRPTPTPAANVAVSLGVIPIPADIWETWLPFGEFITPV